MRFFYKPQAPKWVKILFPVIHGGELFAIYFGSQIMTGYPGWYGAALALTVMCLFELTVIPAILLPFTVMGVYYLTGLPWFATLPVLALPYLYCFFFNRRYRRQESLVKLLRQPRFAAHLRLQA